MNSEFLVRSSSFELSRECFTDMGMSFVGLLEAVAGVGRRGTGFCL